jgi:uncharacterized membrane protein YeiH
MTSNSDRLLYTVDLAGTLLFAMEGAMAAALGHLDFFGLMVLAFATALGGGTIRDLLIGAVPPQSLKDWHYSATAFTGGAIVFFLFRFVQGIPTPVMLGLDAAGLALFAVAGTEKALNFKMHPFIAMLLGTITAVGGGTIRDIFLAQIPNVLRSDIYATAALAGSGVMIAACALKLSRAWAAFLGGGVCFLLRIISLWEHWNLPKVA